MFVLPTDLVLYIRMLQKKFLKKMSLSYKRVLQMFNWNEKNLLKEKAEEPIAELSDVPLPSSMSCEDELGLEIDPYIF